MPQLLLELFSEEIPARMQKRAEEDLARLVGDKLKGAGLEAKALKTFSSPRRLGLVIDDLPAKAADVNEEKKGPRVGAPDQAIQGFLKSAGLKSIEDAQVVEDKKGAFYVAKIERAGRATAAIVQEIVPEVVRAFPWPKSMRSQSSDLQWVRPLHNVLCLFDGAPVKIEIEGVGSKPETIGHRFHAPEPIKPKDFADYSAKLRAAKVLIDREERKAIILEQAKRLCAAKKLELVDDAGLLEEVAGLVEWPVTLLGDMDPAFLDLPGEVIRLSMRTHQKYFAVRDPKTQKLAPHFVTVANVEAKDGGKAIAAGNARVLSARLNDARFFWDLDKKTSLADSSRVLKLTQTVFHLKLGSVWDKVERTRLLGEDVCSVTGASHELVDYAIRLAKCDLVTETVGEFPELQGQIGRELAEIEGVPFEVAKAIEEHYRPLGPNDRLPRGSVSITVALSDKLDSLVAFFAVNERPTGSSDPFALRRAALGYCAIVLANEVRIPLRRVVTRHLSRIADGVGVEWIVDFWRTLERLTRTESPDPADVLVLVPHLHLLDFGFQASLLSEVPKSEIRYAILRIAALAAEFSKYSNLERVAGRRLGEAERARYELQKELRDFANISKLARQEIRLILRSAEFRLQQREGRAGGPDRPELLNSIAARTSDILRFMAERLKVQLREQGKPHDLVDAALAVGDDDLVRIVARVEALDAFLKTEDGANLLAGYKRAANILAAEEKKGKGLAEADLKAGIDAALLKETAEKALFDALEASLPAARAAVEKEDFAAAMKALSGLRAPVDAFFDTVMVNADVAMLRRNRLLLLSRLREALSAVADFSKIEG